MMTRNIGKKWATYAGLLMLGAWGILTLGCSTAAMKSTPLWDSEYHETLESGQSPAVLGQVEDRVNVWPFFYYREPALSVLWPLFSMTPEGNALVPFYEWEKKNERLRVGTIHQALFPLANFEKDGWRVVNVYHDKEDNTIGVFPVFLEDLDDDWILMPPLFFKDENIFWSIPWTQRRDENSSFYGVLGPLFWVSNNGEYREYRLPAPLTAFWRGEDEAKAMVWPLFNYTREENDKSLNLGWLLYRDKWNDEERELHYLLGLGGVERKGDKSGSWLIPFYYGDREGEKYRWLTIPYQQWGEGEYYHRFLWPVYFQSHQQDTEKLTILPLFSSIDEKGVRKSLYTPLYSFSDDGSLHNYGIFLYHDRDRDGRKYRAALWPLAHWWENPEGEGSAIVPFYYHNKTGEGRRIVTPLGASIRDKDKSLTDILGPVYIDYKNLKDDSSYRSVAFPFFHQWKGLNDKGHCLLPLYLSSTGDESRDFISLPFSYGHNGDDSYLNLALFLYDRRHDEWDNRVRDRTHLLWPFIEWNNVTGEHPQHGWTFFPLAGYSADEDSKNFMSWLSSWEVSQLGPDERRERLLDIIGDRAPTKIAPEHEKTNEDRWYGVNVQTEQSFRYHLPFNLINVRRGLRAQWLGDSQTAPPGVDVAPVEYKVRSQDSETSPVVKTGQVRLDRVSESWVFPLYYSSGIEDMSSDFNILWRLYDSRHVTRDNGDEYVRRRVLWRVMHYEHEAGRTSMDMFPFIAWDKAGDLRKFSFAAGLIEFGREGGKSKMKLLWIPMGF